MARPVEEAIEPSRNGLFVPFRDHEALAEQAIGVLAHPKRFSELDRQLDHSGPVTVTLRNS